MQNSKSKKRLEQVAERSLSIGNDFYKIWMKTKDTGAGRLAISSYNTVNKATQTIIDLEQLPTKSHNRQVIASRKKATTLGKRKVAKPGKKKAKSKTYAGAPYKFK